MTPIGEIACHEKVVPHLQLKIAPLGELQCVLRNKKAQHPTLVGRKFVENKPRKCKSHRNK